MVLNSLTKIYIPAVHFKKWFGSFGKSPSWLKMRSKGTSAKFKYIKEDKHKKVFIFGDQATKGGGDPLEPIWNQRNMGGVP